MSRIELVFDTNRNRISGNPLGRAVYRNQVENKINTNEQNIIVFPTEIEKVGSSFVQGFFADLVGEFGIPKTLEMIKIEAKDAELVLDIYDKLCRVGE